MPEQHQRPDILRALIEDWRQAFSKEASGGLWAFAGLSFQASVFLLKFFRSLTTASPLPAIEELSDIVCPTENQIHIVQVKRTLSRQTMAKTLEEFAKIIRLARNKGESALLDALRFQIVCSRRESDVAWPRPSPLEHDEAEVLSAIEARQCQPFILEQADPLEDLWALLWSCGIREPQAVIRYCSGRLLDSFGRVDQVRAVYRDLIASFENAPRLGEGRNSGVVVLAEDVVPNSDADSLHKIVVGGGFGFRELREGCFRHRPAIFDRLSMEFERWLSECHSNSASREISVFWIDGRSGEGKSVLLRQLVAHTILYSPDRPPVIEVSREDVPRIFKERREHKGRRALLVVDDIYAVRDRDVWEARLLEQVQGDLPALCMLVCGPTEQREEFENRLAEPFRVSRFTVPPFEHQELKGFIEWFSARVCRPANRAELTTDNPLLVQLIFEMAEGMTLREFARRFRNRVELRGGLALVQRVLALSALYLETPINRLSGMPDRNTLDRLSQEDQRHLRVRDGYVDFGHAHLAGEVLRPFLEVSYPHLAWHIAWAHELSTQLVGTTGNDALPRQIISALRVTGRLEKAEKRQVLDVLYRADVQNNSGSPSTFLLPSWLQCLSVVEHLILFPPPLDYSIAKMRAGDTALHPSIARWACLLSERANGESDDVERICWEFLISVASFPASSPVAAWLIARTQDQATRLARAREWLHLGKNDRHLAAILQVLVAKFATKTAFEEDIWARAAAYLNEHWGQPYAAGLLRAMIARCPESAVEHWLDTGTKYLALPEAMDKSGILGQLLLRSRARGTFISLAIDYVLSDAPKKHRDQVLFDMARACRFNLGNALSYLETCPELHRSEVARAIAYGARRYPARLDHVEKILKRCLPIVRCSVLGYVLKVHGTFPGLDTLIVDTLHEHSAQEGYWFLLKALRRRDDVWERLRPSLRAGVVADSVALAKVQLSSDESR